MRIDFHSGPQPASEPESNGAQNAQSAKQSAQTSGREQDQTQLSGAHAQVPALAARAAQLPEIRAEKVQSLREALAHGRYRVEPEKVAGALLSHMLVQPAG